jgi:hypothetical protein
MLFVIIYYSDLKKLVQQFKESDFEKHQEFLSKPIVQGKEYKIYKVTDIDTCIKIGQGTSWCIQGEETAKHYLSKGPLYLVTKNNHRFALLSFESSQFMDVNDNELIVEVVKDIFSIWPETEQLLDVTKDGLLLEYIDNQTEKVCIDAVKEDPYALQFVKKQTPEICLVAVKRDGWALQYVKEQTPEICLAAVKQNGWVLQFVKEQTLEICLEAVKKYRDAVHKIRDPEMRNLVMQKLNIGGKENA